MKYFQLEKRGEKTVIAPVKDNFEIDINVVEELKVIFAQEIAGRMSEVYMDFGRVVYIDSSGLGLLISVVKNKVVKLNLVDVSEEVREVFKATNMTSLFNFIAASEM